MYTDFKLILIERTPWGMASPTSRIQVCAHCGLMRASPLRILHRPGGGLFTENMFADGGDDGARANPFICRGHGVVIIYCAAGRVPPGERVARSP